MEQNDNKRDTARQRGSGSATQRRNTNRRYNNATSRERAKKGSDYSRERTRRDRERPERYSEREAVRQRKPRAESDIQARRPKETRVNEHEFDYQSTPFFSKSSVSGNINTRTNRADDFFENKDYKPWDTNDEFNKNTTVSSGLPYDRPRVKRKSPTNASKLGTFKSGVGRVSKRVLISAGSDENDYADEQELDIIAENIKTTRNNKRLMDELNSKKKPLSKKQRKFKNVLLAIGMALGVFVIGLVLSLTVLFRCENIIVEGVTRYDQQAIISASTLDYGKNIFLTNRTLACDKIEAKYPYIEEAEIRLSIPNTLRINVTEATPEYYIQDGTRYYIISKNSKLLEEVIERDQNIPTIKGCKLKRPKVGETVDVENSKVITVLNEVAESMTANAVTGIKEINLSDMSNIELNYEDRITIVIGMPEDIDYKIRTAMTIIYTKLSEADKGRLNCSNLVEGRTDGKANQSSFRPNNLIVEETTETPTEIPTLPIVTESATEEETATADDSVDDSVDDSYDDSYDNSDDSLDYSDDSSVYSEDTNTDTATDE